MHFVSPEDWKAKKKAGKEQREKLGLDHGHKGKKASKASSAEPKDAMQKVEVCFVRAIFHHTFALSR